VLTHIAVERDEYFMLLYHQTVLLEHGLGGECINI